MATGNNSTYNKGSQSNTRSKTTASRSTSTARSPQKARSSQSSRQASASRTGGRKTKAQLAQEQARKNEIHLFICLAVCTFFFISNFGWCGVVGNFFAKFMFGLFGVVEYVLPLYIFLTEAFLLSNGAKKAVVNRVLCVGLFIVAAAFIFQLTAGADHMTAKLLYDQGAQEKKGGGFILGGLLVVLYNLIGKPGAIIVIALLIIIGIIVVMNVSLINFAKERSAQFKNRYNALYEDDDEEAIDPEAALEAKRRTKLDNIKVEQEKPAVPVKKKKKKVKNKKVEGEEVHELKPLPHEDLFNPNLTLQDAKDVSEGYVDLSLLKKKKGGVTELRSAKADIPPVPDTPKEETVDFFDRPDYANGAAQEETTITDQMWQEENAQTGADISAYDETAADTLDPVHTKRTSRVTEKQMDTADVSVPDADEAPVTEAATRKRKKTKESEQEMLSERDQIAETIQENSEQKPIKEYKFPPLKLLKSGRGKGTKSNEASVRETAMKLKSTLENFGVNVTVTDYSCGPSVTRYELQPEQGVKVSKITNLADDIKLNLAAADIRIEAPIPGKPAVGIEVPNKESQPVFFRDLLESDNFQKFPSNIAFAVGKDISGQVVVADIAKMPHLLIAGATGSGKSVCINTLIMSILYKAKPDDVKLIMVDPKQVELSIYNGIPHMLIPVVTDPKKAAGALNWAVGEMLKRYSMFSEYNVRNIHGYNALAAKDPEMDKMSQTVIFIDELADLIMASKNEVEDSICRLAQMARAAGMHLVIATQRPTVDVVTGLIKANIPSRIALKVSSGTDSRVIMDEQGAEKLLGKGDMLFKSVSMPKPIRVQGCWISDKEVERVVDFLKNKFELDYDDDVMKEVERQAELVKGNDKSSDSVGFESGDIDVSDDKLEDAIRIVVENGQASVSTLQRKLKLGFGRAARLVDVMEEMGIVGPSQGSKPREVLMTKEQYYECQMNKQQ